jgi:hypothetical protein
VSEYDDNSEESLDSGSIEPSEFEGDGRKKSPKGTRKLSSKFHFLTPVEKFNQIEQMRIRINQVKSGSFNTKNEIKDLEEVCIGESEESSIHNGNSFEYAYFNGNICCIPCYESIGIRCYSCKDYIDDDYVTLDSGRYHPYCIKCNICKKVVENNLCEVKGNLFHPECYMKTHHFPCGFCDEYILDQNYYTWKNMVSYAPI